jgi:hypothetical protein
MDKQDSVARFDRVLLSTWTIHFDERLPPSSVSYRNQTELIIVEVWIILLALVVPGLIIIIRSKACAACVLKMDHHCPWLGTCVGLHNHSSFVLWLVWTSLLSVYCAITCGVTLAASISANEVCVDSTRHRVFQNKTVTEFFFTGLLLFDPHQSRFSAYHGWDFHSHDPRICSLPAVPSSKQPVNKKLVSHLYLFLESLS